MDQPERQEMIQINGSAGEGGGQIVRSALALSAITGKPFAVHNVRGKRKRPGLLRQHLAAVNAAARVSCAAVSGAELHSSQLTFEPSTIQAGHFCFDIGSAGSATLVLQTVLPALLFADGRSMVEVTGGTHNPLAPCYDYLERVYLPLIEKMGPAIEPKLVRHGFAPSGGGQIQLQITPTSLTDTYTDGQPSLRGLTLLSRGKWKPSVTAIVSQLPTSIGHRELDTAIQKLQWRRNCGTIRKVDDAAGPGNVLVVELAGEQSSEMFTGFGAVGVTAERVASRTAKEVKAYLELEDVPVGPHLADQLLLPCGLAAHFDSQVSRFRTASLTEHSRTHIELLSRFLEIQVQVQPDGKGTLVTVS